MHETKNAIFMIILAKNHKNLMNGVVEEKGAKKKKRTKPSRNQICNERFLRG